MKKLFKETLDLEESINICEKDLFLLVSNVVLTTYIKDMNAGKMTKDSIKDKILDAYFVLKDASQLI